MLQDAVDDTGPIETCQDRQVYTTELYAAAARGIGSARAMQAAREAVDRVEANLDLSTRSQLGPYTWDQAMFGHALLAGPRHNSDAAANREAADAAAGL